MERKYIKIYSVFWIAALFVSFNLSAQSFKDDLNKMYSNYTGDQDFQLEVKIAIATGSNVTGRINKTAYVIKSGNKYLSGYDKTEVLLTEGFMLMVDHQNKTLVYRAISNYEWKLLQKNSLTMNLDSIYNQCDSVRYIGERGGMGGYRIYSKNKMIAQTDLWLDLKTKALEKLVYEYNIKYTHQYYRTEMTFSLKKITDQAFTKLSSVEKIVLPKGKKIELNQDYKQYKLTVVNEED